VPGKLINLARMLRNERLPVARLAAEQNHLLRGLLRHAVTRVPFYTRHYRDHRASPEDVLDVSDLPRLPIVDKQMLRDAGADAQATGAPSQQVVIRTSGSSGALFEFPIDRDFDCWRKAQYLRPYLTNGRGLTDRVLRLTAFPSVHAPWFTNLGLLRETQLSCAADPAAVVARWREIAPQVLQGYPSSLRALAQHCLERGEPLHPAPRRVFSDSELLTPDTRQLIERAFGASAIDVFGTYETDNVAYQCELGGGYHVALDCVALEVVRDGKPVAPGEAGELVVTVLRNRLTPFIRYNLRDIGAFDAAPCACGRTFPLLRVIAGRSDDQMSLGNGRTCSPLRLLGRMDGTGAAVKEYQVEQTAVGAFTIRVVPAATFDSEVPGRIERLVCEELPGSIVHIAVVPAIARGPGGKFKAFVSSVTHH
jgi:phenylacetate-CoA ligase